MASAVDEHVQRIAEKGREALRARLHEAFEEAAAAHADVLELEEGKLEAMVERAVERADGLQWRRALAAAATEELGIGLGEALAHPAVAEAQLLVGAPSYEEGLAAIAEGRAPASAPAQSEGPGEQGDRPEAGREGGAPEEEPAPVDVRIAARHVDGFPELQGEDEVTLVFSEEGLEVVRGQTGAPLAGYSWADLGRLQVRPGRRAVLRRRAAYPRVIVGAGGVEAKFDVEGVDVEWLEERLAPALARVAASA